MAALKSERRVFLWRVSPVSKPAEAPRSTLEDIIGILEALGEDARVYLSEGSRVLDDDDEGRNPKNQLYIARIRRSVDPNTVTLLINRGDPTTVSPAFIDTEENSVRVEDGGPTEVPGWSAHLTIALDAENGAHRACFEKMPRVSSSLVMTALDRMIERAIQGNPHYTYEVVEQHQGRPRVSRRRYRPTLAAHRVPSEKLLEDLDRGELTGVTLTKRREFYAGVGVDRIVKRQLEKVVIDTRPADKNAVVLFLQGLCEQAREERYESISFHIDKLPGNVTNNPTIPLDDQDALEQLYVRARRLAEFENILQQCYSEVCEEIETKMRGLLVEGGW